MRKTVCSIVVLGLFLSMAVTSAWAAQNQYRIRVNGLSCPFCAYGIEKKFNQIPGVEKLHTDIAKGAVIVTMKDGAKLDKSTAAKAVKDAGFALGGFEEVKATGRK